MRVRIAPGRMAGKVSILPSKSQLHRLLICAALANGPTLLRCADTEAEDVKATIACLKALGSEVTRREEGFFVRPLARNNLPERCILPCEESGSTLRFLLPVVCALGVRGEFHMKGRLPKRPLSPLLEELIRGGCRFTRPEEKVLCCEGKLQEGNYHLPGNVSSQYISAMLLALPLLEKDSVLTVSEPVESKDYITMTIEAEQIFSAGPEEEKGTYHIRGGRTFHSPGSVQVEGDWSNAAFWLCAGAMPEGTVTCLGLQQDSRQGDRAVCEILEQMGARVVWEKDAISVRESKRKALDIDAAAIPDLIPVLAAVAAVSDGVTWVRNASRLRLKESDRLSAIAQTLSALGAEIKEREDGLQIVGKKQLRGGHIDARGDHRIAMMAAVASTACREDVVLDGAQAVAKSYPAFWAILKTLGKQVTEEGSL